MTQEKRWTPPKGLLTSYWELIVSGCCFELEDDCDIWNASLHDFQFMPNDIKRKVLAEGHARLAEHLAENGWPENSEPVDSALKWLEAYITNIDNFLETGEYPYQREQRLLWEEGQRVAGRRKSID